METVLEAIGVNKIYTLGAGRVQVLRDASVQVSAGEVVAIMGPSGAGKSTLLHALGGLDQPTEGRVVYRGRDLYALDAATRTDIRAREVGFVFQAYYLLPELDVIENVLLAAMAARRGCRVPADVRQRALVLLERVGLAHRLAHTPLELSGGEQQRVAIARALINEPGLILADEPTGNLDSATGEQVLECLFGLARERGHTLVMVTHNQEIASRCDRVVRMKDGRLLAG